MSSTEIWKAATDKDQGQRFWSSMTCRRVIRVKQRLIFKRKKNGNLELNTHTQNKPWRKLTKGGRGRQKKTRQRKSSSQNEVTGCAASEKTKLRILTSAKCFVMLRDLARSSSQTNHPDWCFSFNPQHPLYLQNLPWIHSLLHLHCEHSSPIPPPTTKLAGHSASTWSPSALHPSSSKPWLKIQIGSPWSSANILQHRSTVFQENPNSPPKVQIHCRTWSQLTFQPHSPLSSVNPNFISLPISRGKKKSQVPSFLGGLCPHPAFCLESSSPTSCSTQAQPALGSPSTLPSSHGLTSDRVNKWGSTVIRCTHIQQTRVAADYAIHSAWLQLVSIPHQEVTERPH